ncbi:MAG: hypothetical protein KDA78_01895 [Planctomycetaceae bacterium]|nr:hypothetical protein [Planctomycetaceae bacterium]
MKTTSVPIQNLYYLLAYAWDHFRSGEEIDVDQSQCPDAVNLLAMLLGNGIRHLATSGMDKSYKEFVEETPRLRGRINVLSSYRKRTHLAGRMICEYDELTANTIPNRILKSTCQRLAAATSDLTKENRSEIRHALSLLPDVDQIHLNSQVFRRFQLHRNNRHYRLLMHVCQLLHELHIPDRQSGSRRFKSILDEETVMHKVFEGFVRQFAIRHCLNTKVSAMKIEWDGQWTDEVAQVLPGMLTDVTLERPNKKTILDCKFYRDALVTRHNRHRLHSAHLYQLVAYLRNKAIDDGWETVNGVLLYPAVSHHLDLVFTLQGHGIEIRSVDLDQPWPIIHQRMKDILG